jgi:hypothetical protein
MLSKRFISEVLSIFSFEKDWNGWFESESISLVFLLYNEEPKPEYEP